jgi:polysaccharide chain length determinant protein (PEP-CTERM system associated)
MDNQIDLFHWKTLRAIFRRRKRVFFTVVSLILGATAIIYFVIPKTYVSQSTILTEQMIPPDYMKMASPTFMEERLQYLTQQIINREKLVIIAKKYNLYMKVIETADEEQIAKKMKEDIEIKTIRASDMTGRVATVAFTLAYQYVDPVIAQQVASTLADLFLEKNTEEREKRVSKTAAVLQQTVDELKEQLNEYSKRLREFKMSHPGELPDSIPYNNEQIAKLSSLLEQTNTTLKTQQEKRDFLQAQIATMLATNIPAGGNPASVNQSLSVKRLRSDLEKLRMKYSEKHPDVIRTKRQLEALEKKMGESGDTGNQKNSVTGVVPRHDEPDDPAYMTLKTQFATTEMEIRNLSAQRNEIRHKIESYERKNERARMAESEYTKLVQDHERAAKTHSEMMNKLMEARAAKGVEETQQLEKFTIIEKAQIPQKPEKSRTFRIIITGIFLAFFTGIFSMIMAENFDHSVKSANELQRLTMLPVLTTMPYIMDDKEQAARKKQLALYAKMNNLKERISRLFNPLRKKLIKN